MKKESEFLNKIKEELRKRGGIVREDINKDALKKAKDELRIGQPLSYHSDVNPESIQETIKQQRQLERDFEKPAAPVQKATAPEIDYKQTFKQLVKNRDNALSSGNTELANKFQKNIDKLNDVMQATPGKFQKVFKALGLPALGAAASLYSGDTPAAALQMASAVDPTGASDLAYEVYRRQKQTPEERVQQVKEDKYEHLAGKGMGDEAMQLQQLEDLTKPVKKQPVAPAVKKANIVNPSHQDDMVYSEKQKSEKEPLEEQSKKLKNMFNLITGR
jgi:hypothetical protein